MGLEQLMFKSPKDLLMEALVLYRTENDRIEAFILLALNTTHYSGPIVISLLSTSTEKIIWGYP
jgi:hypothetical protein